MPVPKTPKPQIDKLRPISLLPLPSRIFERLVFRSDLFPLFISNYGISQFGSSPNSSTTCALLKLQHFIVFELDKTEVAGVQLLAYDYSKAYDKLGHKVIIDRLIEVGFPERFVKWAIDYLTNRYQAIKVGDTISTLTEVTSGVPQGSVLGPAFYNLVASTLSPVHSTSCIIKYVDDTTLAVPVYRNSNDDNIHVLEEHENMCTWSSAHGLILNLDKSKTLYIGKTSNVSPVDIPSVPRVNELKLLGVTIDSQMKWKRHFNSMISTASSRIYAIRILKPILSKDDLVKVYNGLIRSVLEYSSPLFVGMPAYLKIRLQRLQNRVHRIVCNFSITDPPCECTRFPDLDERRLHQSVVLFNSILNNENHHRLNDIMPGISSRSGRVVVPVTSSNRSQSTFVALISTLISNTVRE